MEIKKENGKSTYPSIFLNTLPKSGSIFLYNYLSKSLNLTQCRIDSAGFPETVYIPAGLKAFCQGNMVAQAHYEPSLNNAAALLLSMDKMCLHIRDPRSAAISWLHFMDYTNEHDSQIVRYSPQHAPYIGEHWMQKKFDEKFDIIVEFFYSECIEWLKRWFLILNIDWKQPRKLIYSFSTDILQPADKFAMIPQSTVSVLLTTYEDMVLQGEMSLFQKIFKFYNIDFKNLEKIQELQKVQQRDMSSMHFRKGKIDSWKTECSREQQQILSSMIPDEWSTYFGWEKNPL